LQDSRLSLRESVCRGAKDGKSATSNAQVSEQFEFPKKSLACGLDTNVVRAKTPAMVRPKYSLLL